MGAVWPSDLGGKFLSAPAVAKWTAADLPDLAGRHVVVTGGNSGIGLVTVRELCRHGAAVVLAARDPVRGEAAVTALRAKGLRGSVRLLPLDLASLASVRRFAAEITALDVLVNNAGVMAVPRRTLTEDGFEMQFGVNHLGHFALTALLMPVLLRSAAPRVVTVASLAHRRARLDFDNLQGERRYSPWAAYCLSKLANLLFAQELRRRFAGRLVSVAVHPGVSLTNLALAGPAMAGGWMAPLMQLGFRLVGQSAERGALPSLQAASGEEAAGAVYIGPNGLRGMFGYPAPAPMSELAKDPRLAARLWEVSVGLTKIQ